MAKRKTKRQGPSKSDSVREALKTMTSPSEIVAALGKKGIKVSPQMVSTLKNKGKKKRRGRKPGRKATAATNGHTINVQSLFAAKALLAVAGEQGALEALAVVKKLG